MKHMRIYHLVHIEPGYRDATKNKQPCITHYFVLIALPSISFVMTAARSPHYSLLSSLLSITSLFAFHTHPFTQALLRWQTDNPY